MTRARDSYTHYPRPILWLIRGGQCRLHDPDSGISFAARVESFYAGKLPVTNRQYEAFDSTFARSTASPGDDDPAVGVSFDDATAYCDWYATLSRKPMRLPTEIEWEHACRGGSETRYFFGDDPAAADDWLWDRVNSPPGRIPRLRDKKPCPSGLLAMLGGVWEWTASLYRPYSASDGAPDPQASGPRVLRGGSFREHRDRIGCGVRRACARDTRADDISFRIARSF